MNISKYIKSIINNELLSPKRLLLALIFSIVLLPLFPPIRTLSQLGIIAISPNKLITASEIPEFIYQHINVGFSAYFGSSVDKSKSLVMFQAQGGKIEWELLPKELPASTSGKLTNESTPSASLTPTLTPEPTTLSYPSATPILGESTVSASLTPSPSVTVAPASPSAAVDPALAAALLANNQPPQSTLSSKLATEMSEIKQNLATLSGKLSEIASEAAKIKEAVENITELEIIRSRTDETDFVSFKRADAHVDISYYPIGKGLKQVITLTKKSYSWPLVFLLNPNGLLLNKNSLGEFFLSDPKTKNPIINLGTFVVKAEGTSLTETAKVEYSVQNDRLAILIKPSSEFLEESSKEGNLTIENTITVTDQKTETDKPDSPVNEERTVFSGKMTQNTFEDAPDNFKYQLDRGVFKVKLFNDDNKYAFSFESKGKSVTQSLKNETTSQVNKITAKDQDQNVDEIEAKDVISGKIDLIYKPLSNGIKETVVLNDKSLIPNLAIEGVTIKDASISAKLLPLSFSLGLNGLRIEQDNSNRFHFVDTESNIRLFRIEAPFAKDASGVQTNDVTYKIDQNNNLSILIDQSWLESPDRVYPIFIDPTYTVAGSGAKFDTATNYAFQRKSWYDGSRYWVAFSNGTGIDFYYSADNGATWTKNTAATALSTSTTYSESPALDTANSQMSANSWDTFPAALAWKCERVQAGASGKIDKIELKFGDSVTNVAVVAKADGGSNCSAPGSDISDRIMTTLNGSPATFTFDWGAEGTPLYKNGYFCLCAQTDIAGKKWYSKSGAASNHYKRIWMREQNADFSVLGDESNAYITYRANSTDILARKNGASYPGTGWNWGSAVSVFDGGAGGADTTAGRYDFPNIASNSGKIHFTAREALYQGAATSNWSMNEAQSIALPTAYSSTPNIYIPFQPTDNGTISSVDIRVNSTGASRTVYVKLCSGVSNCGSPLATGSKANVAVGINTIPFSTNPYVSDETQYSIFIYASANDVLVNHSCTNNSAEMCLYAKLVTPQGPNLSGNGVMTKPRSGMSIVGKKADLDLTNLAASFTDTSLGSGNANMGNIIVPGRGSNNGDILFLYNDGTALKYFTYNGSTYSSSATVANSNATANSSTRTLSAAADNTGKFHAIYVNSSSNLVYQSLTADLQTWSAVSTIDSNADNFYPSLIYNQGGDILYATWFRTGTNTVYFSRMPANIPNWSAAQTLNSSASNTTFLSTLAVSPEQLVVVRTSGTDPTFDVIADMIDTGLGKMMRHGRTFENETKQRFAY